MSIVDDYFSWLKSTTFTEQIENNATRISFPFLDRNNDYTEIYIVKQSNNEYLLTDDGTTYNDLEFSGFDFTPKRLKAVNDIANSYGVAINDNMAIYALADVGSLSLKMHMLVQCLTKISDLFTLRNSNVKSLFTEEIAAFLDSHDIRYSENVSLIGKSKLPCQFDFLIPKSKNAPERLIKGINTLNNTTAKLLIFGWEDTRSNRNTESRLITFINNIEKEEKDIKYTALSSLSEYDITPIIWTKRVEFVSQLSA